MQAYPEFYNKDTKLFEQSPYYEKIPSTHKDQKRDAVIAALPNPYVLKTHLKRWELHNRPEQFIHIARNPLDTALSFFFHDGKHLCEDLDYKPWHLKMKCIDTQWFEHVKDWHEFTEDEKQPLFLTYEEMHKSYFSVVLRLCGFCKIDLSTIDFNLVQKSASFSEMKQVERILNHPQSGAPTENFCRKGIVGDWKNHLHQDMVQIVYDHYYNYGIDQYYGKLEDWAEMYDWLEQHPTFNKKP